MKSTIIWDMTFVDSQPTFRRNKSAPSSLANKPRVKAGNNDSNRLIRTQNAQGLCQSQIPFTTESQSVCFSAQLL
jgi:hypothetical protein